MSQAVNSPPPSVRDNPALPTMPERPTLEDFFRLPGMAVLTIAGFQVEVSTIQPGEQEQRCDS